MFYSTQNKGFRMEFSNGYAISCQFGTSNYCSRKNNDPALFLSEMHERFVESKDCEIAVINMNGNNEMDSFVTGEIIEQMGLEAEIGTGDGMVVGWVSADNVAKIIAYISAIKA